MVPSSFNLLRALIIVAFFQANTIAEIITPAITATAKSFQTVIPETMTITKASEKGILFKIRKLLQANVPITTINITPTKAAIGICSISGAPYNTKISKAIAAVAPESLPRPPESTLIIDCPIMAQPPIPPNNPLRILALPCAIHSLLPLPRDSVISSIKFKVIKDSISPTAANKNAVEMIRSQFPAIVSNKVKI